MNADNEKKKRKTTLKMKKELPCCNKAPPFPVYTRGFIYKLLGGVEGGFFQEEDLEKEVKNDTGEDGEERRAVPGAPGRARAAPSTDPLGNLCETNALQSKLRGERASGMHRNKGGRDGAMGLTCKKKGGEVIRTLVFIQY